MKISKEELLRINDGFGGGLISSSSLEFAIEQQDNKKFGIYTKLAYLWRAILVDHPFSDANKRTAVFIALAFSTNNKKQADKELLVHHATSIAKGNITNIRQIAWRLKNAIR